MAQEPLTMQLRYLQTVTEIASENNSTTIFPLPMELLRPFMQASGPGGQGGQGTPALPPPPPTQDPTFPRVELAKTPGGK
jgi:hypothetical protein